MVRLNNNTNKGKGKHLNYERRLKIEALSKAGLKSEAIGAIIGCSGRAIRNELAKGKVELLNSDLTTRTEYSADIGEQKHQYAGTGKGPSLKIGNDYRLVTYIEDKIIKEKMSPYAVAECIKQERFQATICCKTIYNYIDEGLFPNLTNKHLPVKKKAKKRQYDNVRTATNNKKGTSISERPKEIDERKEFGHWEMDTVVGKSGTKEVLMVMTERKTLKEIIRKIQSKSQYCIVKELDKIERKMGSKKFRETFKTITCDNGCENLDFEGIERSSLTKSKRTKVYYAHPYSAWERGSNENANKLIRRFIPKGADIGKFSHERIKMIEHWINNYPRRSLNGLSSDMIIKQILVA
ncbi:MAG: IS30 family transposase [Ruminococcus sp.]|nr:IS30 family transposase [Candidatus Copronaster equi]